MDSSAQILSIAMSDPRPGQRLMEKAAQSIQENHMESLIDIDAALDGFVIELIRKGNADAMEQLIDDLHKFIDSSQGDQLKSLEEGVRFFYRWEHLMDLSQTAIDNYDPKMMNRFIESRKHGKMLLEILSANADGIRQKDLAEKLHISTQQLARLLNEFEEKQLITREKNNKAAFIRLDFLGKVYMAELEPAAGAPLEAQEDEIEWEPEDYDRCKGFFGVIPKTVFDRMDKAA